MITDYKTFELIKEIPTEEKPILINNYPYGFRLKTTIAYWIETKGNKQRFCSKTINPKTNLWNKPKYSTYEDIVILAREKETGHIKNLCLNITYSNKEEFDLFLEFLSDFRTEHINRILKFASAIYETRKSVKVSVRIKEDGEEEKQKAVSQQLNKIFVHNALKEGLSIEEIKRL